MSPSPFPIARGAPRSTSACWPLDLVKLVDRVPASTGFGRKYPEFWLNARPGLALQPPGSGAHVCLRAPSVAAVQAFHADALQAGGANAGDPGPRQAAFTAYIGAFIFDPDGNKIEAVFFPRPAAAPSG